MDNKIKEIFDKVLDIPVDKHDSDGYVTDFNVLEIQNMIRDYYAKIKSQCGAV